MLWDAPIGRLTVRGGLCALLLLAAAAPLVAEGSAASAEEACAALDERVLQDPSGTLSAEDVLGPVSSARFLPLEGPRSFGLGAPPAWVRLVIENPSASVRRCAVAWDYPLVEHLDLYLVVDGVPRVLARGGLARPAALRTLAFHGDGHGTTVELGPGERRVALLRAETRGPAFVGVSVRDDEQQGRRSLRALLLFGAVAGVALLLAFIGACQWAAWRDASYLLYAGFVLAYGLYAATVSGLGPFLLWPEHPDFALVAQPLFSGLSGAFGALFIRAFLEVRRRWQALDRVLVAVAGGNLAAGLVAFLDVPLANALTAALAAAALGLGLFEGVRAYRRGLRRARFYVVGFGLFSVFGALFALTVLGGLRPWPALHWGLQAGFAVTGVTFVLALSERRLGESEERFRVAFETSPDAIALNTLENGVYVAINPAFTRITGWRAEELVGRSSLEISMWADPGDRARLLDEVSRRGAATNLEFSFRYKDGTLASGLLSARVIQLQGQDCLLSITREISALKAAEHERARLLDELRQAQKMEAIGRLAGGIAHDFNNLLTIIRTNASCSLEEIEDDDPSRDSFREIKGAADRAATLTKQLLTFGRRQVMEPRRLDLSAQVGGVEGLLRRLLGEDLALSFHLAPGLPPILADPGQVEQVVMNLALNAREALRYGGAVVISTYAASVLGQAAKGELAPGDYCVLSVCDDGPGMSPEVRDRVLEPFFTTKKGGTGLGLAIVHGIARQHGAHVDIETAPGEGATFRVWFPVARGGEGSPSVAAQRGAPGPTLQ
ncbi:MAG TPA: 7TM diverse intracellular signaling domain-containing protein [Anaeromyxobacteraceae bacterium]|nr:7TM diverse intracellular signaling domain-containing protein [Anaeromyxobacteraceae bacterium]